MKYLTYEIPAGDKLGSTVPKMGKSTKEAVPSVTTTTITTSSADRIKQLTKDYVATKSGTPVLGAPPSYKAQFDLHPPLAPKKKAPSSSKTAQYIKYDDLGIDMSLFPSATSTVKFPGAAKKPDSGFGSKGDKGQETPHLHNAARRSFDNSSASYDGRGPHSFKVSSKTTTNDSNDSWYGQPQTYEASLSSRDRVNQLVRNGGKGTSPQFLERDVSFGDDARSNNGNSRSVSRGRDLGTDNDGEEGQNFCTRKPVIKEIPADGLGYVKTSFRQPFQKAPPRPDPLSREYHRKYDDETMLSNDLARSWRLDDDADAHDDSLDENGPPVASVDAYSWKKQDFVAQQCEYQEQSLSSDQDKVGLRPSQNFKLAPSAHSQDVRSQTSTAQRSIDQKPNWEAPPPRSFPLSDYDHDEAHHAVPKYRIEEPLAFPLSRSNDADPSLTWSVSHEDPAIDNPLTKEGRLSGTVSEARSTIHSNNYLNSRPNNHSNDSLASNSQLHAPSPMTRQAWVICPYCHSGFGYPPLDMRSSSNPEHETSSNP